MPKYDLKVGNGNPGAMVVEPLLPWIKAVSIVITATI